MKMLRIILLFIVPAVSFAGGNVAGMQKVKIDIADTGSLQRGARNYVNYCMGCHSLKFSSYLRVGKDLRLTEDQVVANLIVSYGEEKKVSDYMKVAMTKEQGKALFSKAPPDLSVISRAKGINWLYSYMKTFYKDESRPFGVNNLVFPNVGMPHVTVALQGVQKAVFKVDPKTKKKTFVKFEMVKPGSMNAKQYDDFVKDLVAFLAYVGEPAKLERQQLGVWVLLFMLIFTILAYLLKKEYWKDVH